MQARVVSDAALDWRDARALVAGLRAAYPETDPFRMSAAHFKLHLRAAFPACRAAGGRAESSRGHTGAIRGARVLVSADARTLYKLAVSW